MSHHYDDAWRPAVPDWNPPGRQDYVYYLDIRYPEGSHEPGWRPAAWLQWASMPLATRLRSRQAREYSKWVAGPFRWPREHLYLSSSGAYARAALLRSYGAEVTVHRSQPVRWDPPEPEPESEPVIIRIVDVKADTSPFAWPPGIPYPAFDPSGIPL